MHTHQLLQSLPRCLLSAALVAGMASTAGVYAVDGAPPGLFELDGNTVDAAAAGDDWGSLHLGNQAGSPAAFTGILSDPAPVTIYTQGGSKDVNDVTQWRYTNGSVPDKDDITNAYATAYVNPADVTHNSQVVHAAGDLIIYFGLDRFANNGDAFAGFWFFQNNVTLGANGRFNGQHVARQGMEGQPGYVPGDLLVLVEYPQGANAQPEIKVYEWDPLDLDHDNVASNLDERYSSANAKCDGTGDKLACAITNVANLPGAPEWPYTPKNGFAGIPFESFFEGGINVSKLLGGDVPCFSSFLAETRSSRSETAQLKDFVLGDFNLCSIAVTKQCTAAVDAGDGGNSVLVNYSGTVTNDGGLPLFDVTVTDDMGTTDTADDVVVFGPATLQPGESQPYNGSYSTLSIPATDEVTAVGHRNGTSVEATAEASCSPTVTPALAVDKACTANIASGGAGIDVLFNGTVTNTGNVALENVMVVDDGGTPGDTSDDVTVLGPVTLNAGQSMPYNGSFSASGSNSSTDTVTATGSDVLTQSPVEATAQATCEADVTPAIEVTKQCSANINTGGTGIDVLFNGTVTNTGNVALGNVTVMDDNGTPGDSSDDVTVLGPISLAPGESANYNGGFSASGSSSTDTVTASGADVLTQSPVEAQASASCSADVTPAIEVTKQCTDAPAFGQAILFDGTVTNTGNVALLNVTVVDDNGTPGDTSDDVTFNLGDLAPGAAANYNGAYTPSLAGFYTNTVVATAEDAVESSPVSSSADATCEVPPPPEGEGCTPGFWKNSPGSWGPTGYSPNQTVGSVFSLPSGQLANQLGGNSLIQALNYAGGTNLLGSAQILLRAAVAAVLNASHPDVDYPRTAASVIADVNAALATKDRATILALAAALDADNNLGCDLANDNSF
ncbi:hypothetical protein BZL41_26860 [Pseudomonas sp. PIC25]|uniref:DUF7507 domain-containing protein n=1 Tax=Pseudomonas sp. PIC25 TaxID=1958773 RepID=UPI000BAC0F79|nr:hypothetical protein [Pseudomonas sp. PIC25]PAU51298.1 hypothetical protein BZL41_26860 [Pseudomonas sp. PIC25]